MAFNREATDFNSHIRTLPTPGHCMTRCVFDPRAMQQVVERAAFGVFHDDTDIRAFHAGRVESDDVGMADATEIAHFNKWAFILQTR